MTCKPFILDLKLVTETPLLNVFDSLTDNFDSNAMENRRNARREPSYPGILPTVTRKPFTMDLKSVPETTPLNVFDRLTDFYDNECNDNRRNARREPSHPGSQPTMIRKPITMDSKLALSSYAPPLQTSDSLNPNVKAHRPIERINKHAESTVRCEKSGYIPLAETALASRDTKRQNRVAFKLRQSNSLPAGVKHKSEVSPYLDLKQYPEVGFSDRLVEYSRHHKCPHGKQFNTWTLEKERYIKPSCDHVFERVSAPTNWRCSACNSLLNQIERICECKVMACTRCKRQYYRWLTNSTRCDSTLGIGVEAFDFHHKDMNAVLLKWNETYTNDLWTELSTRNDFSWKKHDEQRRIDQLSIQEFLRIYRPTKCKKRDLPTSYADAARYTPQMDDRQYNLQPRTIPPPPPSLFQSVKDSISSSMEAIAAPFLGFFRTILDTFSSWYHGAKNAMSSFFRLNRYFEIFFKFLDGIRSQVADLSTARKLDLLMIIYGIVRGDTLIRIHNVCKLIYFFIEKLVIDDNVDDEPAIDLQTFRRTFLEHQQRDQRFEPQCNLDTILSLFSGSNSHFGKTLFKSVKLFCSDILPLLSATNHAMNLTQKIYKFFHDFLGFWLTDTREWILLKSRDPSTPLHKATICSMDYFRHYIRGESKEQIVAEHEAKAALALAIDYFQQEKRYDHHAVTWVKDIEYFLSKPPAPQSREHEPFCLRLVGKPGTGKSSSAFQLVGPIFGHKTRKEFDDDTFYRGMSQFWDGVGSKRIVMYDDFGQDRSTELDYREFINLISCAPFMPDFATLVGKNVKGTSVAPKMSIVCTNCTEHDPTTIQDATALKRRFHVSLLTTIDKQSGQTMFKVVGGSFLESNPQFVNLICHANGEERFMDIKEARSLVYVIYAAFIEQKKTYYASKDVELTASGLPPLETPTGYQFNQEVLRTAQTLGITLRLTPPARPSPPANFPIFRDKTPDPARPAGFSDDPTRFDPQSGFLSMFGSMFSMYAPDAQATGFYLLYYSVLAGSISVWRFHHSHPNPTLWTSLQSILKATVIPVTILCAVKFFQRRSTANNEPQSSTHKAKLRSDVPISVTTNSIVPQSSNSTNLLPILQHNLFHITRQGDLGSGGLNGLFVKGTYTIIPEHFFIDTTAYGRQYIPQGTMLTVKLPFQEKPVEFPFNRDDLIPLTYTQFPSESILANVDACLYKLPITKFNAHRTILHHFWDGSYTPNEIPGLFCDYVPEQNTFFPYSCTLTGMEEASYIRGQKTYVQRLCKSSHPGRRGACGSPMIDARGVTPAPILGFHVAYDNQEHKSMVLLITRNMIERALPDNVVAGLELQDSIFDHTISKDTEGIEYLSESIEAVASLNRKMYRQTKTQLEKSELHGIVPVTTEPSVLMDNDPRAPPGTRIFLDGIKKLSSRPEDFPEDLVKLVKNDMIEYYNGLPWPARREPLTLHETLNKTTEWQHLNGVDLTTSAGYPYVLEGVNRAQLFTLDGQIKVPTPRFLKDYEHDKNLLLQGQVPEWPALATLKDERRPIDKVRIKPKTRIFAVCPLLENIFQKQLYGPFFNFLLSNQSKVAYAGGVDRLGASWNTWFNKLLRVSDVGFGGDYEWYDGRLIKQLMLVALDICVARMTLTPEWKLIHETLKTSATESFYAFERIVISVVGSLRSGLWITQLIGSLVNEMMLRLAWYELVPTHFQSGFHYNQYVNNGIMGDDNINAVNRYLSQFFNARTYSQYLLRYGQVYTNPSKKGDIIEIQPLEDVSFLKNTTGLMYGYRIPIMDFEAAVEPLNWIRKNKDLTRDQRTEMNCNGVLKALFYHGETTFNKVRTEILSRKPQYKLYTFGFLLKVFLEYGYFPGTQAGELSEYDDPEHVYSALPLVSAEVSTMRTTMAMNNRFETQGNDKTDNGNDDFQVVDRYGRLLAGLANLSVTQPPPPGHANHFSAGYTDGKWNGVCTLCQTRYAHVNRFIDHLFARHQVDVSIENKTIDQCLETASISQLRSWYTDLQALQTSASAVPNTEFGRLAKRSGLALANIYHRINLMLSEVKTGIFTTKTPLQPPAQPQSLWCTTCAYEADNDADFLRHLSSPEHVKRVRAQQQAPPKVEPQVGDPNTNNPGSLSLTNTLPVVAPVQEETLQDPTNEVDTASNQLGYTVVEKNQLEVVTPITTAKPGYVPKRAASSMNDINWDLSKMLEKWTQVVVLQWSLTDAVGSTLTTLNIPGDLITNSLVSAPFKNFQNFRNSITKIKFLLVGSKPHQGRLIAGFVPSMAKAGEAINNISLSNLVQIGSVQLDPCTGSDSELEIPFRHPKGHLDLLAGDSLGYLQVRVLNKLQVVTGSSTTVNLKIMFCMKDTEFKIPRASTASLIQEMAMLKAFRALTPDQQKRLQDNLQNRFEPQMLEPLASVSDTKKNEGVVLGPTRAPTDDPATPHFGETYNSIRDICKRYRLAGQGTINISAQGQGTVEISVEDLWTNFPMTFLFAAVRGPLNIKVIGHSHDPDIQVLNTPFVGLAAVFESSSPITLDLHDLRGSNCAMSRFSDKQPLELSIPYLGHSAIAYHPANFPDLGIQRFVDYRDNRKLCISVRNLINKPIALDLEWYVAFGDETECGIFIGAPPIKFFPNLVGGIDGWHSPPTLASLPENSKKNIPFSDVPPRFVPQGLDDTLSQIINRVIPDHLVTDLVTGLLDKPQVAVPPEPRKLRDVDYLAHATGPAYIDKLMLYPSAQQLVDPEHFGTGMSEMMISTILKDRRSLLTTFNWSVTQNVGDVLFSTLVGPMSTFPLDGALDALHERSLIDWIALNFSHWRGSITITLDAVTALFQEGRGEACYAPNQLNPPATYDGKVSQYVASFSLKNTQNTFTFTVPFLSETPWKKVWNGVPLAENNLTATGHSVNDFFSGVVTFVVANPLRVPNIVVNNIDVNVYIQAGDDFELCNMTLNNACLRSATQ